MRCRLCGDEITINPRWGAVGPAWVNYHRMSICEKASYSINSTLKMAGNWHEPDENYEVTRILQKYDNPDINRTVPEETIPCDR